MKLPFIVVAFLIVCSFTGASFTSVHRAHQTSGWSGHEWADQGWISLFNGRDLTGWDTYLGPERDSTGKKISDQPKRI